MINGESVVSSLSSGGQAMFILISAGHMTAKSDDVWSSSKVRADSQRYYGFMLLLKMEKSFIEKISIRNIRSFDYLKLA